HSPTGLSPSSLTSPPPPTPTLFPYTTLFRSGHLRAHRESGRSAGGRSLRLGRLRVNRSPVCVRPNLSPAWRSGAPGRDRRASRLDRKSTRLNSSHLVISYAVFCLKKKTNRSMSCAPQRRSSIGHGGAR